jgi:FtsZ-binding cell division protein ZapB
VGVLGAVKLAAITVILVLLFGGLYYVSGLRADIAISESNNRELNSAILVQQSVIDLQQMDIQVIKAINAELSESNANLQKDINTLNTKFKVSADGQSRDFGSISRAKPKLIEKIINKASNNAMRCFELAAGAELEAGEKNSECQELIDSL